VVDHELQALNNISQRCQVCYSKSSQQASPNTLLEGAHCCRGPTNAFRVNASSGQCMSVTQHLIQFHRQLKSSTNSKPHALKDWSSCCRSGEASRSHSWTLTSRNEAFLHCNLACLLHDHFAKLLRSIFAGAPLGLSALPWLRCTALATSTVMMNF